MLTIITSCTPVSQLSRDDLPVTKRYLVNSKKSILKARKIQITDSLRRVQELDISQENNEEMYLDRE